MTDKKAKKILGDIELLSRDVVREMKDNFKSSIKNKVSKAIPPYVAEGRIKAIQNYMTVISMNPKGINIQSETIEKLSHLKEKEIKNITKAIAAPLFEKHQREEIKYAANIRYKKEGHALLDTQYRRLYFPLNIEKSTSDLERKITDYLSADGYVITDYNAGYATDVTGKQTYKIGKLLKKDKEIFKEFVEDTSRSSSEKLLVLSNYINDIAYMSTRRGWESCMAHDGMYKEKISHDVGQGTLIAYLISAKDPYIHNPLARILLKPFCNVDGETVYHANASYGLYSREFADKAKEIADTISKDKIGVFHLPSGIYKDGAPASIYKISSTVKASYLLDQMHIDYKYDGEGRIIVEGDLRLSSLKLTELPDLSNVIVKGDFDCSFNNLTNLKGSPYRVDGNFYCNNGKLSSLEGATQEIKGCFNCEDNKITSLKHAPKNVLSFYCNRNKLKDLVGAPQSVEKFHCDSNMLETLKGGPKSVNAVFSCSRNQLSSLQFSPRIVKESFYCTHNLLTTLEYLPQTITINFNCDANKIKSLKNIGFKILKGYFSCAYNELESLEGTPEHVGEGFYCNDNNLRNLIGAPKVIEGQFMCARNKLTSLHGISQFIDGGINCSYNNLLSLEGIAPDFNHDVECIQNDMVDLMGIPQKCKSVMSDFGNFTDFNDIPHNLVGYRNNEPSNKVKPAKPPF